MKKERLCIACGTKYEYCPRCNPQDKAKPTWMYAYDKEGCMQLWKVMSGFSSGYATREDVKRVLNSYNIVPERLLPNIRTNLEKILNSSTSPVEFEEDKVKVIRKKRKKDNEQLISEA